MLLVVCGPSGVGKSTLVQGLMSRRPKLRFSISHTTRPPRGGERDGVEYYFVTPDAFEAMLRDDGFVEHASVHAHRYGTARSTLEQLQAHGFDALLDIDHQGVRQISRTHPEAVTVLIAPPSMGVLETRLRSRATDSEEQVLIRLDKARDELSQFGLFNYLVVNDVVESAIDRLDAIYTAELARITRNEEFLASLLNETS